MQDRSIHIVAANLVFMILSSLTMGLRVYCRGWIIQSFGLDDKLMVLTWACTSAFWLIDVESSRLMSYQITFIMYLTAQLLGVRYGTGKHHQDLNPGDKSTALMCWFVCELIYIFCTCLLKVSIGFFLLRISIETRHVWIVRFSMFSTAFFGISYFFVVVFQCSPASAFWEKSPRAEGTCLPQQPILIMTYTASCLNCAADCIFGVLPAFIVWSLKVPRSTRILVAGILSFAAVGSIATIVRSTFISTLMDGDDFLYATTDVAIWSTVEPGIGICAACMATLRPLLQLLRYKAGFSDEGPNNPSWQRRKFTRRQPFQSCLNGRDSPYLTQSQHTPYSQGRCIDMVGENQLVVSQRSVMSDLPKTQKKLTVGARLTTGGVSGSVELMAIKTKIQMTHKDGKDGVEVHTESEGESVHCRDEACLLCRWSRRMVQCNSQWEYYSC